MASEALGYPILNSHHDPPGQHFEFRSAGGDQRWPTSESGRIDTHAGYDVCDEAVKNSGI